MSAVSPHPPLGVRTGADGGHTVAVCAPHAESVELCWFPRGAGPGAEECRTTLRNYAGGVWWDTVAGLVPGTEYGFRAHGPWDPERGSWYNPAKLLVDPYAEALADSPELYADMFPVEVDSGLRPIGPGPDPVDSAPVAPRGVVLEPAGPATPAARERPAPAPPPRVAPQDAVVYELHVKGFTRLREDLPPTLRGTYAGLGAEAVTGYLRDLGVTHVELLPIHACLDEPHLVREGRANYWGYNTLNYFAPDPALATAAARRAGPAAVVREVEEMIESLHRAGLRVILDVVYNHTGEGGADGPMASFRGLDNLLYYWTEDGRFLDVTGCGNTLDVRQPRVAQLVLDSLRHWVRRYGVDGFRFDLATSLGRTTRGFRRSAALLTAIGADPELRDTLLIAEPWDLGGNGLQTGSFPDGWSEWNDSFRNDVRDFWLASPRLRRDEPRSHAGVRDIATRMAGSADLFTRHDPPGLPRHRSLRSPQASLNFVTAHDGFTLADLTRYEHKHNEANGEDDRDGTTDNRSDNHGWEGEVPLDHPRRTGIAEARQRSARNLLGTLLLAAGTPMLTAGDEFGRTQDGNNNPYNQDSALGWVSWPRLDAPAPSAASDLHRTVRHLLHLRREHGSLRPVGFLTGTDPDVPTAQGVDWFDATGAPMTHDRWMDPRLATLQMLRPSLECDHADLIVLHSGPDAEEVCLPASPGETAPAQVLWSSDWPRPRAPEPVASDRLQVSPRTLLLLRLVPVRPVPGRRRTAPDPSSG